jgi:hypothetical protein
MAHQEHVTAKTDAYAHKNFNINRKESILNPELLLQKKKKNTDAAKNQNDITA